MNTRDKKVDTLDPRTIAVLRKIIPVVKAIRDAGLRVWLSESQKYGYFCGDTLETVVSFEVEHGIPEVVYIAEWDTDDQRRNGTGWIISDELKACGPQAMLDAPIPPQGLLHKDTKTARRVSQVGYVDRSRWIRWYEVERCSESGGSIVLHYRDGVVFTLPCGEIPIGRIQ